MIYLIDTIGKEVGMHLYNDAFVKEFQKSKLTTKVISNYGGEYNIPIFANFYKGNVLKKIILLLSGLIKMFFFFVTNRKNVYVYQSYGMRYIDILFTLLFFPCKSFFLIVHDVYALTADDKKDRNIRIKDIIYKYFVKNVICHSERTIEDLSKIGYKGNTTYFPHFNYSFNKEIKPSHLSEDVVTAVDNSKLNLLFFGQISLTKGIDVVLDALDFIEIQYHDKINIIVAGSDKAGLIIKKELPSYVYKICRYIDDSELNYLFLHTDFILLPYKKIYQSGVLDTAVYFNKPIIISDIEYFSEFNKLYPSFTEIVSPCNAQGLANKIMSLVNEKYTREYYAQSDNEKYMQDHDSTRLIKQIRNQLSRMNLESRLE